MAGESVPLSVPIAAIVSHRELTPINDYTQTQNNETKITPLLERESRCHRIVPQPMLPYYSSTETPQEIKKVNKTVAAGSSRLGGEGGGGLPTRKKSRNLPHPRISHLRCVLRTLLGTGTGWFTLNAPNVLHHECHFHSLERCYTDPHVQRKRVK